MNYLTLNRLGATSALALLAGCATLPPADPPPQLDAPRASDFHAMGAGANPAAWPDAQWWHHFGDPQLDHLIEAALAQSPSMAVAQARFRGAEASAGAVAANAGIDVAADANVSRQRYPAHYIYPPPLAGGYATSGQGMLNFSYDFDFWGRNRKALDAALGEQAAAAADADAAAITLSAAVATAYFQWQALDAHVAMQEQVTAKRGALVDLERRRVDSGMSSAEILHPLTADAAAPRQGIAQLEAQRDLARHQLQTLVGGHDMPALASSPLPAESESVPAGLHLDLVARRPDVAAARDRVEAALQNVESARAAYYPDFSITAFLGLQSLQMSTLLEKSALAEGVTPAFHLPIFDSGRLDAALDSRRADTALAVAQYDQAVVTAVGDVNDALSRLDGSAHERIALDAQRHARQRDVASAGRRVEAGLTDRREVVRDELTLLILDDAEITRHAQALEAEIALAKSLGGGWGPDGAAPNPSPSVAAR